MTEHVFTPGQIVSCKSGHYPELQEGNKYEVLKYIPAYAGEHFTWPAAVVVKRENGKTVEAHVSRFVPSEGV